MSKDNVRLFYEALAKNKTLQAKLAVINREYQQQKSTGEQKDPKLQKKLINLAGEAGFNFTLGELNDYASEMPKPTGHELSEEEMAAVSGGTCLNSGNFNCSCTDAGAGTSA